MGMSEGTRETDASADAQGETRRSACPGLFRIVPARDGGICRVKLPLGQLSVAKARAVAASASRFGSGIIEATSRANLQIRGIRAGDEAELTRSLVDAGLGPSRPDADDVRNVMVSPTAGIDPLQQIDARPIARELLAMIDAGAVGRSLSAKFCILVDGGESVAAVDRPHDIWLASLAGGAKMAIGFAGAPPIAADDVTPFITVPAQHAVAAVTASLALFAEEPAGDPAVTRFRHLLARISRAGFIERLAERLSGAVERRAEVRGWRRRRPAPLDHVGVGAQRQGGLVFVGAVPPFGRLSPDLLARLAEIAEEVGDGGLRLTPWQSVILPSIPREIASRAVTALEAAGLTCDPSHPLASIVACAGMAGCSRAKSDTKADALALAWAVGAGAPRVIHLSGCSRSCACAGVADATLLASAPGRYELFVKADAQSSRFGRPVAGDLTVRQAAEMLREMRAARSTAGGDER
ncbi:MAG TPA: precorrin-3B synthase [Stellaceae bacterium]|jgi:precorrin-3B synthase